MFIPMIGWGGTIVAEFKVRGKSVGPGTVMSIKGARGLYTLKSVSWSADGKISLNCVGGPAGHTCWRSFRPDRVKKVY